MTDGMGAIGTEVGRVAAVGTDTVGGMGGMGGTTELVGDESSAWWWPCTTCPMTARNLSMVRSATRGPGRTLLEPALKVATEGQTDTRAEVATVKVADGGELAEVGDRPWLLIEYSVEPWPCFPPGHTGHNRQEYR